MLPDKIKRAITQYGYFQSVAQEYELLIRDFVIKHKGEEFELGDSYRDMFIDCLELSNNPELFIRFLEHITPDGTIETFTI